MARAGEHSCVRMKRLIDWGCMIKENELHIGFGSSFLQCAFLVFCPNSRGRQSFKKIFRKNYVLLRKNTKGIDNKNRVHVLVSLTLSSKCHIKKYMCVFVCFKLHCGIHHRKLCVSGKGKIICLHYHLSTLLVTMKTFLLTVSQAEITEVGGLNVSIWLKSI